MKRFLNANYRRQWLAIVGAASIIILAAYAMAQQSTRQGANELPLVMSQTIKHELDAGAAAADAVPPGQSDLRSDSIAFAIITNSDRQIQASSASLDGKKIIPPSGTFNYAKKHGSDTFTWQPDAGVRLATRVTSYQNSSLFIVTGQSLSEPEKRIETYGAIAVLAWVVAIAWVTIALSSVPHTR